MFTDRLDAAEQLAAALAPYRGRQPLLLAIPRGAVPMAARIAERLQGDVDLVLVRKLHAPGDPEFAVGAVDESGWVYVAPYAHAAGATAAYIEEQRQAQLREIARRRDLYTPGRSRLAIQGRVAIVVAFGQSQF